MSVSSYARRGRSGLFVAAILILWLCAPVPVRAVLPPTGKALQLFAHCMAGNDGSQLTVTFSGVTVPINKGDILEYDILIPKEYPHLRAGVVAEDPKGGGMLLGEALGDKPEAQTLGQWVHRSIPLDKLAGKTLGRWQLGLKSEQSGDGSFCVAHLAIKRTGGEKISIYEDGAPTLNELSKSEEFSQQYVLRSLPVGQAGKPRPDMAIMVYAKNISKGEMDFYVPVRLTNVTGITLPAGAQLEYDLFIPKFVTQPRIAVDLGVPGSTLALKNTVPEYKEGEDKAALGAWHHRVIPLPAQYAGKPLGTVDIQFDGDAYGDYVAFLDNIAVTKDGRTVCSIYTDSPVTFKEFGVLFGYSNYAWLGAVPRGQVATLAADPKLVAMAQERVQAMKQYDILRSEDTFAAASFGDAGASDKIAKFRNGVAEIGPQLLEEMTPEAFLAKIQGVRAEVAEAVRNEATQNHRVMQKYSGHLVGHAHIDLQWVWSWQHTIDKIIPETFGSALKFMADYPDFTFSQSSGALYEANEQHHPEMFKQIQKYVKEGRWELLGGRWCEGDTNMLTGEEHVRQFLLGQLYFQHKFGKTTTVGWEPDTFGHTWMMPQILRKSGIDCYYFCRAGKNIPIFWWESPDGSKVLGFCDDSGYNGAIDASAMREMPWYKDKSGLSDAPLVYGVGNHGGGPTRESIDSAHEIQKSSILPKLKFTTARETFTALEKKTDLAKIPTVRDELNPTFRGGYTSVCDIKWWNRKLGERLPALESLRVAATRNAGSAYPQETIQVLWRDLSRLQHHDTLCGTSIHPSNQSARKELSAAWNECNTLEQEAMNALAARIAPGPRQDMRQVLLFNATGTPRQAAVAIDAQEIEKTSGAPEVSYTLVDPQGKAYPAQWVDERTTVATSRRRLVSSVPLPACGWVRMDLNTTTSIKQISSLGVQDQEGKMTLTSPALKVTVDKSIGSITSIVDIKRQAELLTPGKGARLLEIHEADNDMSAWDLGKFLSVDSLPKPTAVRVTTQGAVKVAVEVEWKWRSSKIYHEIALEGAGDQVLITTNFDWREMGSEADGARLIKFAVPFAIAGDKTTYEIPFASVERAASMGEVPAMRWAARSDGKWTMALLNDSRHGHDFAGGELRLSLIRSSRNPDGEPNQGWMSTRYAIAATPGALDPVWLNNEAESINAYTAVQVIQPMILGGDVFVNIVKNPLPASHSMLCVETPGTILSAFKQAEDGKGTIARVYDVTGKAATAELRFDGKVGSARSVDLIERPAAKEPAPEKRGDKVTRHVGAHEIVSIRVTSPKRFGIF